MSTPLGSSALALLARLTAPKPDHEAFTGTRTPPDLSSISREELGEMWDAVDDAMYAWFDRAQQPGSGANSPPPWENKPAFETACDISSEVNATGRWPAMTDEQLLRYLQRSEGDGRSWQRALQGLAWRADRSFPLPAAMCDELRRMLGAITPSSLPTFHGSGGVIAVGRDVREALCIARHLQPDESGPEVAALQQALRQSCADTSYLQIELEVLLSLSRQELCQQCWPFLAFNYLQDPRYQCLPEQFLRDACQHLEAIQSGKLPYVGYKAFAEADVTVLCWAYRIADKRKVPWLAQVTHTLQVLASYAPDKKSKSLPSQTLACQLAELISLKPTPEGIASVHEAYGLAINATVKRTLGIRLQQAKTAMALRPNVVLALVASGAPDKKQQTMLATLLQASDCTGLDFSLADWKRQLIHSTGAGEFTRNLIWFAQHGDAGDPGGNGIAFMAQSANTVDEAGTALRFTDSGDQAVEISEDARIRLWHPLHACAQEREDWQRRLTALRLRQPLRQAFREYYEPLPQELQRPLGEDGLHWNSNESQRFAGFMLSLKPLIGLARGEGWKIDRESGLVRQLGNLSLSFGVGEELHPGIQGNAESSGLAFWKGLNAPTVRLPIRDVAPIIYSEACRAADLLVSVSAFGYTAGDAAGPLTMEEAGIHLLGEEPPPARAAVHPAIKRARRLDYLGGLNIADMAAMRRQVLKQAFASQVESGQLIFEGRSAKIGDYSVNLATAQVQKNGEQIELKLPKAGLKSAKTPSIGPQGKGNKLLAVPWLPYDEALLEELVGVIAFLL